MGLGSTTNISNQAIRDAKGQSGQQQTVILAQARQAIVAALTQNATPGTSAQSISDEADKIVADIQSKI
jgi:SH3-like domain-containing protein